MIECAVAQTQLISLLLAPPRNAAAQQCLRDSSAGMCPADCPWNHYRTGPDNSPSFFGGFYHLWHWATPYLAVKKPMPASRPGCYAYPDQLGIGGPVKGTAGWAQARANGACVATPRLILRI